MSVEFAVPVRVRLLARDAGRQRDGVDGVDPGASRAGILVHSGEQHLALGDSLHLRPIDSLWSASDENSN